MADSLNDFLSRGPVAINLGVEDFAASLKSQGAEVVQVDWAPPAGGDRELTELLDQLL
jgi:FdrA protein